MPGGPTLRTKTFRTEIVNILTVHVFASDGIILHHNLKHSIKIMLIVTVSS